MKFSLLGSLVTLLALVGCSEEPTATPVSTSQMSTSTVTPVASTVDLADPLASSLDDPFPESNGLVVGNDVGVPDSAWNLESPLMGQGTIDVLPIHGESQQIDLGLDSAQFDSGSMLPQ